MFINQKKLFYETYLIFYTLNFEKVSKKIFFRNLFTLFKMFHQEPTPISLNKNVLWLFLIIKFKDDTWTITCKF